jgi:hypothetical protein
LPVSFIDWSAFWSEPELNSEREILPSPSLSKVEKFEVLLEYEDWPLRLEELEVELGDVLELDVEELVLDGEV